MSRFTDWYVLHGEELNQKRKLRYELDEEYRKNVIKLNNEYKNQKKEVYDRVEVEKDGKKYTVELVTVAHMCALLVCPVGYISKWEKSGLIPETPYRDGQNRRLYTIDMVDQIRSILEPLSKIPICSRNRYAIFNCIDGTGKEVEVAFLSLATVRQMCICNNIETYNAFFNHYFPESPYVSPEKEEFYSVKMVDILIKTCKNMKSKMVTADGAQEIQNYLYEQWGQLPEFKLVNKLEQTYKSVESK